MLTSNVNHTHTHTLICNGQTLTTHTIMVRLAGTNKHQQASFKFMQDMLGERKQFGHPKQVK